MLRIQKDMLLLILLCSFASSATIKTRSVRLLSFFRSNVNEIEPNNFVQRMFIKHICRYVVSFSRILKHSKEHMNTWKNICVALYEHKFKSIHTQFTIYIEFFFSSLLLRVFVSFTHLCRRYEYSCVLPYSLCICDSLTVFFFALIFLVFAAI